MKFFFSRCVSKYKIYKGKEIVKCEGLFEEIVIENVKAEMKKTGISRERMGSIGSTGAAAIALGSTNKQSNMWIQKLTG